MASRAPASALADKLCEVMGTQEYADQVSEAQAVRTALRYLRADRDRAGAAEIIDLYQRGGGYAGEIVGLRAELATWQEGEAEALGLPDLPEWAQPLPGAPTGAELVRAAAEIGCPITDDPLCASVWLLPDGRYLSMIDEAGRPAHHEEIARVFVAAGQVTEEAADRQQRFALRTGALRVFLPEGAPEGPSYRRAYIARADVGEPISEAQAAALRPILREAETLVVERLVVAPDEGGRASASRGWSSVVQGRDEEVGRAAGHSLRLLLADTRDERGRPQPPPAVGLLGRVQQRTVQNMRKALLVFGRGDGRARRHGGEGNPL